MTLLNADGSLLSKEIYKYEFDFAGNWNKMTTAVAVIEGGKMSFEPTEVTYRSIMYYLDENMMKMAQPPQLRLWPSQRHRKIRQRQCRPTILVLRIGDATALFPSLAANNNSTSSSENAHLHCLVIDVNTRQVE